MFIAHARNVHSFASRKVGPDSADDVVVETFVEAWRSLSTFDPLRGTPESWLFGIARHVIHKHRAQEKRWLAQANAARDSKQAPGHSPEMNPKLRQGIESLTPEDKTLLAMVAEDIPVGEASRAIGIDARAGRVRLYRLRKKLRDLGNQS